MKKGFTLVEIIIVVVVLGIVASLTLPRLAGQNEKVVSNEARQTLAGILTAQKAFFAQRGVYADETMWDQLDMTIPASTYFEAPRALPGPLVQGDKVACIWRQDKSFALEIWDSGQIVCQDTDTASGMVPGSCAKAGCRGTGVDSPCNF